MNDLTVMHVLGIVITLAAIMVIGVKSGKKVKSAKDFITGGMGAGGVMVSGMILGTLIGGSSTIGTAELAFNYGLSAWWFTIGSGLGCVLMALYVKALRASGCTTIQQIITKEYGDTAGVVTTILTTIGIVINIIAQILAANALLSTIFGFNAYVNAVITVLVMICYVVFGGALGAGILGIVKLGLIASSVFFGAFLALKNCGGFASILNSLPKEEYFNFFARGIGTDLGGAFSVLLGIVSTQTYIQAVIAGKNNKEAVKGSLISAVACPTVGFCCILIGYAARIMHPEIAAGQAFPFFAMTYMNPFIAGVVLATLLLAVVGTGSGMALGFGTIMTNDLYLKFINKNADDKTALKINRLFIIGVLVISAAFTTGSLLSSAILKWGFLSMGLRAAVLIIPMTTALFFKDKVDSKWAILSSIFGAFGTILGKKVFKVPFDSLFVGMAFGLVCIVIGMAVKAVKKSRKN